MDRYFYRLFFLVFVLACSFLKAHAQNLQVEAKLERGTIRIGEQIRLRLIVQQPAKEKVSFPKLGDTITGKLQVVGSPKTDTITDKENQSNLTVIQTYLITSFDAGTYTIPAYAFSTGTTILKTNELTLQVQSVQVDTTKAIYDIKQPLAVTYTFFDWLKDNWVWIIAGILLVAIIVGATWYYIKRPKPSPVVKKAEIAIPEHMIALSKLRELREKKLWQQDAVKQYYSELSDVVREYLERRYVIKTYEKTTDEILASLRYMSIAETDRNKLKQVLVLSDLVKFAKEKPVPAENEESIGNAIAFVLSTQQQPLPLTGKEGGDVNGAV